MTNRFQELLVSTPPVTLLMIIVCCSVYVLQVLLDLDLDRFTMCPRLVIYLHEYYRILTSTVFHGSLMHIGMNMMSTYHLSNLLEKRMGTVPHLMTTLGSILATSAVYLLISWSASFLLEYDAWMYQHSVGFSGVLFHFCVLECNMTSNSSRSLFGVVNVPTYIYPWVLLVVLQFFMPNLSFLGHLSGVLTGTLQFYGLLDMITIGPELEHYQACSCLKRLPGFVSASDSTFFQEPSALGHTVRSGCRTGVKLVGYIFETLWVCIFGRGNRWNRNIRFWSTRQETSPSLSRGHVLGSALEDDEEWGGLPTVASLEQEPLTSRVV